MDKRIQKMINYFIIIQICRFNRDEARDLFVKYSSVLDKPYQDCLFDFDFSDKNILNKFSNEIMANAKSVVLCEKNIVFYEDDNYQIAFNNIEKFLVVFSMKEITV